MRPGDVIPGTTAGLPRAYDVKVLEVHADGRRFIGEFIEGPLDGARLEFHQDEEEQGWRDCDGD